ncbi:DNA-binding protein [Streptomyces collinus]
MTQPIAAVAEVDRLTVADVLALPPTVDLVTGGRAFGLGRTTSYRLARSGQFPCKVVKAGGGYRVVTADLRRVLELGEQPEERASA